MTARFYRVQRKFRLLSHYISCKDSAKKSSEISPYLCQHIFACKIHSVFFLKIPPHIILEILVFYLGIYSKILPGILTEIILGGIAINLFCISAMMCYRSLREFCMLVDFNNSCNISQHILLRYIHVLFQGFH